MFSSRRAAIRKIVHLLSLYQCRTLCVFCSIVRVYVTVASKRCKNSEQYVAIPYLFHAAVTCIPWRSLSMQRSRSTITRGISSHCLDSNLDMAESASSSAPQVQCMKNEQLNSVLPPDSEAAGAVIVRQPAVKAEFYAKGIQPLKPQRRVH